jgi:hypothetical protein
MLVVKAVEQFAQHASPSLPIASCLGGSRTDSLIFITAQRGVGQLVERHGQALRSGTAEHDSYQQTEPSEDPGQAAQDR